MSRLDPQSCRLARHKGFSFATGNLVLVKWDDGMVYFAKIKRIDRKREKCTVVFDDKSQDEADFCQIHSVDETTTDIICIKCKKDNSDSPNEIVLCDMCGIGFHQKCHAPPIPASALQLDSPWKCSYCQRGVKCPFITESLDVLQNLLSDDNETTTGDEEEGPVESEYDELGKEESSPGRHKERKKRKYRKRHYSRSAMYDRRKSLRRHTHSPEVSGLVTSERKSHLLTHEEGEGRDDGSSIPRVRPHTLVTDSSLSGSDISSSRKRKRHQHAGTPQKKLKTASVESRTVSVTRIDTPIYEDGSVNLLSSLGPESDSSTAHKDLSPVFSNTDSEPVVINRKCLEEKSRDISGGSPSVSPTKDKRARVRQRKFRVSLTLPDDMGKRAPSTPDIKSPLLNSSSSWEKASGSANNKRSPSFESDPCFTSSVLAQPFLASPLPAVSKKQLEIDSTRQTMAPTKPNHVGEHPEVLKPSVSPPVSVNVAVSKSLNHQTMFNNHSAKMGANVTTSFVGDSPLMDTHPENEMETSTASSNFSCDVTGTDVVTVTTLTSSNSETSPVSLAPMVIASLDSVASVVVASSDLVPPSSQVELGDSKDPSGKDPSSSLASSDSMMNAGDTLESSKQPFSSGTVQKANDLSASSNLDVGVTGRSVDASLPNNPNPVPISTIEEPVHEGVADAAIGISSHPKDPALSSPLPASSHSTPATKSHDSLSVAGSLTFTSVSNEKPVHCSENSTDISAAVNHTSHQNNGKVCTKQPPIQEVALTQINEMKCGPSAEKVQCTVKAEPAQELPKQSGVHEEERSDDQAKPQNPAGAPTPVITKTPHQLRGRLPEQQIVMPDKPTTADQLPPAAADKAKVLTDKASSGAGSSGDPDVIITGIEPRVGEAQHKEARKSTEKNADSRTKHVGAKKVHQSPSVHNTIQKPRFCFKVPPPRPEKTSHSSQVEKKLEKKPSTARPSAARPTAAQYPAENRHTAAVSRSLPNNMHVLYPADPAGARPVVQHHGEVSAAPTSTYHQGTGGRLYHHTAAAIPSDAVHRVVKCGHPTGSVITTKPYAIVNAIPAQPSDMGYRSIALPQKPAVSGGGHNNMVQVVTSAGQAVQQLIPDNLAQQSGYRIPVTSASGGSSLPPPPSYSTYIAGKKSNPEKVSEEEVQSIQKKIGDAFTQSSEDMLLSAFEEALKKFQNNEKAYKRNLANGSVTTPSTSSTKTHGTSSTKTQVAVPKPLPESIRVMPTASQGHHPQQQQHHHHQYLQVAAAPPNIPAPQQQQQQLLFQQIPAGEYYTIPAVSGGNQVRVAGLYYPNIDQSEPHKVIMAAKKVASPTKPQTSLLQRVIMQERPRLAGQVGVTSQPQQLTTKGTYPVHQRTTTTTTGSAGTRHSNKMKCAWCGGGAIYLCSGCQAEWYCGNECQLKSWEKHSDHCKA